MAEIHVSPFNNNNTDTFARSDAAKAVGADNPPIFTAIPRGTSWAIKAVASNGAVQLFGWFDGRLPALGAACILAGRLGARVVP